MIVPIEMLDADSLQGVIEEFVTRDGTDITDIGERITHIRQQLKAKKLVISYDINSGSCSISPSEGHIEELN